jgi:hypothetical protein
MPGPSPPTPAPGHPAATSGSRPIELASSAPLWSSHATQGPISPANRHHCQWLASCLHPYGASTPVGGCRSLQWVDQPAAAAAKTLGNSRRTSAGCFNHGPEQPALQHAFSRRRGVSIAHDERTVLTWSRVGCAWSLPVRASRATPPTGR